MNTLVFFNDHSEFNRMEFKLWHKDCVELDMWHAECHLISKLVYIAVDNP